jgi:transporter family-2 protein
MNFLVIVIIGVLGGLAGALQSQFLGVMESRVGTLASSFITYAGGGLVIAIVYLLFSGGRISDLRQIPWWAYAAGLFGVLIVASLGITVSELGLGAGLTLFTGSTLILAAIIDNFGWFAGKVPFDARRLTGIAVVILGTWLVVGADRA